MKVVRYTALLGLLGASCAVHALQLIEPVEGHNSFVKISAKEITRIAIEGAKIRTLIASDGELAVEKDEDRGQLFVRPAVLDKPINVRLISSSGATYNLIMQAVDVPQDDVIIREPFMKAGSTPEHEGKAASSRYEKDIKSLMVTMALEEPQPGADIKTVNQEFALWENAKFILAATYRERGLVGEKYRLTNTGKTAMRLVEQELYRKGVMAVAIENMQLDPGQSTNIYVVRSN